MEKHDNTYAEGRCERPDAERNAPHPSEMACAVIRQYARAYVDLGPTADVRGLIAN